MKWIALVMVMVMAVVWFRLRKVSGKRWKLRKQWIRPVVTILLLVRNQEQIIEGIVRQLRQLNKRSLVGFEMIVVDNGSQDGTARILDRMWRRQEDFRYYRLESGMVPSKLTDDRQWANDNQVVYQIDLQQPARSDQLAEIKNRVRKIIRSS